MTRHYLWNDAAELLTKPIESVLMGMRREDADNDLLMDSLTLAEIMEEAEEHIALDGVVAQYQKIERIAKQMEMVMQRAASEVKPTARQISDPFMQLGVLQVAAVFELSDGQTISVYFHNPDTTPKKIKATDELVSWKWLLNKKDVTILVAPEQGRELNVREVARRIMQAVEKNSPAFRRNNAKRAERLGAIEALKGEIVVLEAECADLEGQIAAARVAAEVVPEMVEPVIPAGLSVTPKGRYRDENDFEVYVRETNETCRVTLFDDGRSLVRGAKDAGITDDLAVTAARAYAKLKGYVIGDVVPIEPEVVEPTPEPVAPEPVVPEPDALAERNKKYDEFNARASEIVAALKADGMAYVQGRGVWSNGYASLSIIQTSRDLGLEPSLSFTVKAPHIETFQEIGDTLNRPVSETLQAVRDAMRKPETADPDHDTTTPETLARVDAAYRFADASDEFKAWVAESIEETSYSPFASARAMDERAKANGATIEWGFFEGAALDSVFIPDETASLFDDEGETLDGANWKSQPREKRTGRWRLRRAKAMRKAAGKAAGAVKSAAKSAGNYVKNALSGDRDGDSSNGGKSGAGAGDALEGAAKADAGAAAIQEIVGGVKAVKGVFDSATLDDATETATGYVGKIRKDGTIVGRIDMGDDGKAMIFVGASGTERVKGPSGRPAMYSDDDAPAMVDWLFGAQPEPEAVEFYAGEEIRVIGPSATSPGFEEFEFLTGSRAGTKGLRPTKSEAEKNLAARKTEEIERSKSAARVANDPRNDQSGIPMADRLRFWQGQDAIPDDIARAFAALGMSMTPEPLEIPENIKRNLGMLVNPLREYAEGLGRARQTDLRLNGGGRYAAEVHIETKHKVVDAEASIEKMLSSIPDAKNAQAARDYIDSIRPDMSLTPEEQKWVDGFERTPEPTLATIAPEGAENIVKTAKGREVVTGFTVIEAADLIVSHDSNGDPNPDYPAELQPRDRSRESSIAWVRKTAGQLDPDSLGRTRRADTGAPIVGTDRVVESGNGRTMAIREAYRSGRAEEYRAWLIEEAPVYKLSAAKIKAMKAPVLVRVRTSDLDRREFAVEANQDDKLSMTGTEKARADADRLDDALISKLGNDGDLLSAANRDFIRGFLASLGDTEAAQYLTTDGQPTGALIARVQAAVFAKAYNDDRLLELTADASKPEVANIINALNASAPEFIRAQAADKAGTDALSGKIADSVDVSMNQQVIQTLIDATNLVRKAKADGQDVSEAMSQMGLFETIAPATAAMAIFISKNNRSSKRLGVAFSAMARHVRREAERGQTMDMFGDSAKASLEQIIAAANLDLDREYGEGQFAIETIDMFEVTPQPEPPTPEPEVVPQPETTAPVEYRYAAINRPPGYATAPEGYIRIDPQPPKGADHHDQARHGIVVYPRKLTDQEANSYELVPIIEGAALDALVTETADKFDAKRAAQYIAAQQEFDAEEFAAMWRGTVDQEVKGASRYAPSVGDWDVFAARVLDAMKARHGGAVPEPAPDPRTQIIADLQALIDNETDIARYDAELDRIAEVAEAAGLMDELDAQLNASADRLTELLNVEAARVAQL